MKKGQKSILVLLAVFVVLLSTTLYVSFSSNLDVQEVVVKSITPVYDENSTIVVDNNNVIFNDKNQTVEYKVVIENTQNYDVKINDIKLSTPTEEFLKYTVEDISKDDILVANSTKELTISLETAGIEGWGRNFADELTANISFEKVVKQEEAVPPKEDKEEEKIPEKPVDNTEELINKSEKIEIIRVTKDTIEFKETPKLVKGDKVAVWLYSDPVFLGYFDVVETNGIKQIVGLEEALKEADVESGKHHIVLATEENETIGYVEVYVNENNTLSQENPADDGKIENPYTSDKGLLVILVAATTITGIAIIIVSKNKFAKYTIMVIMLSSTLTLVNADDISELPITLNVSFESQNVMKPSGWELDEEGNFLSIGVDYWAYAPQIKNFYIQNEITEIEEYEYEFDVTEDNNGRVMAYLVESKDNSVCMDFGENDAACYDLYLQADGIIYPNVDASYYFSYMLFLDEINNLEGLDTSSVTNMSYMFYITGGGSNKFKLDLYSFNTSNVTDMSDMFNSAGYNSTNFTLDVSNFDTSNVTDMSYMFYTAGYNSTEFTLDVSSFDTSNVTDMMYMFDGTGYNSTKLNVSITISNHKTTYYNDMFSDVAVNEGTQINVNYTSKTSTLVDKMIATKTEGANVVKGELVEIITDDIDIGDEIAIGSEHFNVISQTEDTVTMLAKYTLGTDYLQSATEYKEMTFASTTGWEYAPGPKEIDIQKYDGNAKNYVNEYVIQLQKETGDKTLIGDLITMEELKRLGCSITDNYSLDDGLSCADSNYNTWLVNNQMWWTRSAHNELMNGMYAVWRVRRDGYLYPLPYLSFCGIRPTITISKEALENYLKT